MQAASEARKVTFEHDVIEERSLSTQLCYVMSDVACDAGVWNLQHTLEALRESS